MICWLYLLCRAARRLRARMAYRHSVERSRQLREQHVNTVRDLLAALRAQCAAEVRMNEVINEK